MRVLEPSRGDDLRSRGGELGGGAHAAVEAPETVNVARVIAASDGESPPIIPDEEKHFLVNVNDDNFIAEGYDVVAYFTDNKPVKGDPKIVKLYNGAFYVFATEEHKQLFGADPMKYMPQYGGYCAYAMSKNKLRPIDPQYFQFVDGRLMLQHSQDALDTFSEDIPGNAKKADGYWPAQVEKKAGKQMAGHFDEAVKQ